MTKEDLSKYYLDLDKVSNLSNKDDMDMIHSYYRDMLSYADQNIMSISTSYFNTLEKAGYIKNRETEDREEKIGSLING